MFWVFYLDFHVWRYENGTTHCSRLTRVETVASNSYATETMCILVLVEWVRMGWSKIKELLQNLCFFQQLSIIFCWNKYIKMKYKIVKTHTKRLIKWESVMEENRNGINIRNEFQVWHTPITTNPLSRYGAFSYRFMIFLCSTHGPAATVNK